MDDPTCHSKLKGLHPDMSSGAAEIYAASVALTEVMHLSYIVDEMGARTLGLLLVNALALEALGEPAGERAARARRVGLLETGHLTLEHGAASCFLSTPQWLDLLWVTLVRIFFA